MLSARKGSSQYVLFTHIFRRVVVKRGRGRGRGRGGGRKGEGGRGMEEGADEGVLWTHLEGRCADRVC